MRLIQFINKLNNALKADKYIYFYSTKSIFNLLKLLKEANYLTYQIKSCDSKKTCDSKNKIKQLKILNARFLKLSLIYKPSRNISISYRKLLDVQYDCILSTNIGLLSKEQAISQKTGGFLILKI